MKTRDIVVGETKPIQPTARQRSCPAPPGSYSSCRLRLKSRNESETGQEKTGIAGLNRVPAVSGAGAVLSLRESTRQLRASLPPNREAGRLRVQTSRLPVWKGSFREPGQLRVYRAGHHIRFRAAYFNDSTINPAAFLAAFL